MPTDVDSLERPRKCSLRVDRKFIAKVRALVAELNARSDCTVVCKSAAKFEHAAEAIVSVDDRRGVVAEVFDYVEVDRNPESPSPLAFADPTGVVAGCASEDRQFSADVDVPAGSRLVTRNHLRHPIESGRNERAEIRITHAGDERVVVRVAFE